MKLTILIISIGCVLAAPTDLSNLQPLEGSSPSSQYHVQDHLGQYNYGYNNELSSKVEAKTSDGITRGAYRYLDGNGQVQDVEYQADDNGFQILRATNLPAPTQPLPVPAVEIPQPVEDTPEVTAARNAHLAAVEEAIQRNAAADSAEDNSIDDDGSYQENPQPISSYQGNLQPSFYSFPQFYTVQQPLTNYYSVGIPYYQLSYQFPRFVLPQLSVPQIVSSTVPTESPATADVPEKVEDSTTTVILADASDEESNSAVDSEAKDDVVVEAVGVDAEAKEAAVGGEGSESKEAEAVDAETKESSETSTEE